ncbi:MAG: CpaF family protein [Lachnoclostridium sp.]|jgi:pilus assembly protein CpaF|nr:CpaF family protein [Lachnoclostridium sp.]
MNTSEIRELVREQVMDSLLPGEELSEAKLRQIIGHFIREFSHERYIRLEEKKRIKQDIFNSIRKMDVLQDFLEDEDITEIMVNGAKQIFIEKEGRLQLTKREFSSLDKLESIVQQIASKGNRIVNESSPLLDVRMTDGSRVNIVLPPVAIGGPVITIRKFPKDALTMEDLISFGAITIESANMLKKLVQAKYNIFISGGTGSGKTTFLNILSNYIPTDERIVTIEDSAELRIQSVSNLVSLEARNANIEGKNEVTIRELIRCAMRMRPDRIIVGEVRDAAAIDMLAAFNTGHDGSLSTGHANSPLDMMRRLETLVLMGMDIPIAAIRQQITSAIDILVHLGRLRDKSRRVLEISEVGKDGQDQIFLYPIYVFEEDGEEDGRITGNLIRSSHLLQNNEKLRRNSHENQL